MKFLSLLALLMPLLANATTYTTNYNLAKPNDGNEAWGSLLRDNFDTIDTQMGINAISISDHEVDTVGAHAATAISSVPGATFCTTSEDVQTFLTCIADQLGLIITGGVVDIFNDQTVMGQKTFTSVIVAAGGIETATITNTGTLTLPTSTDTIIGRNTTDTLTNKSIDADSNTVTNIEDADIKASAAIDATKIADGSVTSTEFQYMGSVTSDVQTQIDSKQASGNYVTALTGDVTATGPGSVAATIATSAVTSAKILDATIVTADLANSSVSGGKIIDGTILNADIGAGAAIDALKIDSGLVSNAEFVFLDGVTSAIQTQIDGKQATGNYVTALTGDVTASGPGSVAATIATSAVTSGKILDDTIVNGDINTAAAIDRSKIANGTADHVVINSGAGALSSEASLSVVRGGTGAATLAANNVVLGNGTSAVQLVAPSTSGNVLTSNGTTWSSSALPASVSPNESTLLENLGLSASVAGSALTIAAKIADGSTDASGGSTIRIGFRSSTLTSGAYNVRSVSGALSVVVSSGSTLGTLNTALSTVYVYAIDNAGTVELAVSTYKLPDEGLLISTTAEGGAGAADSAQVVYSTTARSNVPFRFLGKVISTQTVAGVWAASPASVSIKPFKDDVGDSVICYNSGAGALGQGTTNTVIRRFTNCTQTGTAILYGDSATLGGTFTIQEHGLYEIQHGDADSSGSEPLGLSVDSPDLTTNCTGVTVANGLLTCMNTSGAGLAQQISIVHRFVPGNVVRAHSGTQMDITTTLVNFHIHKIAN